MTVQSNPKKRVRTKKGCSSQTEIPECSSNIPIPQTEIPRDLLADLDIDALVDHLIHNADEIPVVTQPPLADEIPVVTHST